MPQERSSPRGIRWGWIVVGLVIAAVIASFFLSDIEGGVQYYMTTSEYLEAQPKYDGKKLKLAGKVKSGTIRQNPDGTLEFAIEDLGKTVQVAYRGLAPDTFKEGSEVVVEGRGRLDNRFEASSLMAKCASKYEAGGLPPLEQMRSRSVH